MTSGAHYPANKPFITNILLCWSCFIVIPFIIAWLLCWCKSVSLLCKTCQEHATLHPKGNEMLIVSCNIYQCYFNIIYLLSFNLLIYWIRFFYILFDFFVYILMWFCSLYSFFKFCFIFVSVLANVLIKITLN